MTTQALFDLANKHHHMLLEPPADGKIDSVSIRLPSGICAVFVGKTENKKEYREKLGHEMGHCEKNAFYTKLSAPTTREKCEESANRWQYENMVPEDELNAAFRAGIRTPWELSDLFDLPESVVVAAHNYYTHIKHALTR